MKMRAQVIGSMQPIGSPVAAAVAVASTVYSWVAEHSGEVVDWFQNTGGQLFEWANSIAQALGIGPSYNPANGGELARQFGHDGGTGWLGQPWCNSYMEWLRTYRPDIWSGDTDVWTAGAAAPTPWRNVYNQYLAVGMPDGTLLDGNMVPVGLASAAAAIAEADAALAQSGGGARPLPPRDEPVQTFEHGSLRERPAPDRGLPPPRPPLPGPTRAGSDLLLWAGLGLGALFLFGNRR